MATVGCGATLAGCTGAAENASSPTTQHTTRDGGTMTTTASDGTSSSDPLADWLADVGNYEGIVDATTKQSVQIKVGTQANGSAYGFAPAAVRVAPGTTVTWDWTGKGGSHNVVAVDGSFESELSAAVDHTFKRTFDAGETTKYYCAPHELMGMKGVVVVE